ncbi:hypothetical protein BZA05DRAFT_412248 [Tricharina praecox]|uniref:uncharacterized protein n=1 Tax=Tricharina praecox TaxID=43433 RepID=UPI0022204FAC|nr:uncharacterized protein BZA05DRAFT_412248 [Tricharina praecox]KAI5842289.1 hypothetical protein BZA05DRAFT_412248 [Tricharina praecox]
MFFGSDGYHEIAKSRNAWSNSSSSSSKQQLCRHHGEHEYILYRSTLRRQRDFVTQVPPRVPVLTRTVRSATDKPTNGRLQIDNYPFQVAPVLFSTHFPSLPFTAAVDLIFLFVRNVSWQVGLVFSTHAWCGGLGDAMKWLCVDRIGTLRLTRSPLIRLLRGPRCM